MPYPAPVLITKIGNSFVAAFRPECESRFLFVLVGLESEYKRFEIIINSGKLTKLKSKPTAVDLFCGCGAVTEGLKSHFDIVAAVDNDSTAAAS